MLSAWMTLTTELFLYLLNLDLRWAKVEHCQIVITLLKENGEFLNEQYGKDDGTDRMSLH